MTLTPTEIESLRIAIAEECGWTDLRWIGQVGDKSLYGKPRVRPGGICVPDYPYSLDAIQAAAMERFKDLLEARLFHISLCDMQNEQGGVWQWQLTALDWCVAFARTAKIWRFKP